MRGRWWRRSEFLIGLGDLEQDETSRRKETPGVRNEIAADWHQRLDAIPPLAKILIAFISLWTVLELFTE